MKVLQAELVGRREIVIESKEVDRDDIAREGFSRTLFTAISPGTELAAYNELQPLRPTKQLYPRLMGYCSLGEIVISASGSDQLVGDLILDNRCHMSGGLPIETIPRALLRGLDRKPELSLSYLYFLGVEALETVCTKKLKDVCLIGGGLLSSACAQLASSLYGLNVTIISDTVTIGDHRVIRRSALPSDFRCQQIIVYTDRWDDYKTALNIAGRFGRIGFVGFPGRGQGHPSFNPLASEYFYDKQLELTSIGFKHRGEIGADEKLRVIAEMILKGELEASRLIIDIRPWYELSNCYDELNERKSSLRSGTFILDWQGASGD